MIKKVEIEFSEADVVEAVVRGDLDLYVIADLLESEVEELAANMGPEGPEDAADRLEELVEMLRCGAAANHEGGA